MSRPDCENQSSGNYTITGNTLNVCKSVPLYTIRGIVFPRCIRLLNCRSLTFSQLAARKKLHVFEAKIKYLWFLRTLDVLLRLLLPVHKGSSSCT